MTLEIIKWLPAIFASVKRLAGGAAEFAEQGGMDRAALGTSDTVFGDGKTLVGRSDSVLPELLLPGIGHPIGGPGGGNGTDDIYFAKPQGIEPGANLRGNHIHGRTAHISSGDGDFCFFSAIRQLADMYIP